MALWQYSFFILPKPILQTQFVFKHEEEGFGVFDDEPYWLNAKVPCNIFLDIESFLPKGETWSEKLTVYGNIDSNCLEVFCQNGVVSSASLRIDFTTNYEPLLRTLIEYFISQGFILLDEELHPVALNYESAKHIIESSTQVSTYKRRSNG